jgi:quinohemoprotein ethanol dehydrogenase
MGSDVKTAQASLGQFLLATAFAPLWLAACSGTVGPETPEAKPYGAVDAARLAHAAAEPGQWLTPAGDGSGSYYSRLTLMNDQNVGRLGFAWDHALGTTRGLEATPVVVDGTLYTAGNWGRVYALDAATGHERWSYDPKVDGQWGRYACCDVVNRGVAVWQGRVYVASLDGYLHALDAASGRLVWKSDTLPGRAKGDFHYFVTGAPVVAGNLIVIGNGGADFKGARGSVAAFDLATGALRWRFYTVPRDPKEGPADQPHLERASATWSPDYDWSQGGGGSVWDGISYDPELGLVYVGTANPAPYAVGKDAPGGDQLYAASILAIKAASGELAWHYQEVPGDGWDYDATQKMVLTELEVDGHPRKVLMQAAKDGFFYVLDRVTGEFLSGRPFAFVNWTRGLDPATHRPLRNPAADYSREPKLVYPAMMGAHSWQPMSWSPASGLAYIPVMDAPMVYVETARRKAGFIEGNFTVAGIMPEDYDPAGLASLMGPMPSLAALAKAAGGPARSRGVLRAFDPKTGRIAWEQPGANVWDGGVLSTAGNLVFQGDAAGMLKVYAADSGKLLREVDVGTSIMAAPMTYSIDGVQYVAVMAGYGGGVLFSPFPAGSAAERYGNAGRVVAFRLDGGPVPKPAALASVPFPAPPAREGTRAEVAAGAILYNRYCARCHVFGRGLLPDLRRLAAPTHAIFYDIVLNGAYASKGMARWDDVLTRSDAGAIHAYLVDEAWQAYTAAAPAAH